MNSSILSPTVTCRRGDRASQAAPCPDEVTCRGRLCLMNSDDPKCDR